MKVNNNFTKVVKQTDPDGGRSNNTAIILVWFKNKHIEVYETFSDINDTVDIQRIMNSVRSLIVEDFKHVVGNISQIPSLLQAKIIVLQSISPLAGYEHLFFIDISNYTHFRFPSFSDDWDRPEMEAYNDL